jgi:hypothetical protein
MPEFYTENMRFIFKKLFIYIPDGSSLFPVESRKGQSMGCAILVAFHVDGLVFLYFSMRPVPMKP